MNYRFVRCIGLIITLLLGACRGTPTPASQLLTPISKPPAVNLLVAVEGQAQIKRDGWAAYTPVDFGARIYSADLLKVEGSASVLCADLSLKSITGLGGCPCSSELGWLEYDGFRFDSQRSPRSDIPYILYPRHTLLLAAWPVLRWYDSGGQYTVSIMSGGRDVWSQSKVTGNMLRYPLDAPALQPGIDYFLVVKDETTGHISIEEGTPGLGFRMIDPTMLETVEQRRVEIQTLPLDAPARDLVLAFYYAGVEGKGEYSLWGEAWLLLESVVHTHPTPAVQILLGDVSTALYLPREAEAAYEEAFQNAKTLGDVESQASALESLCHLTRQTGYCSQASDLYRTLGDVRGK